MHIVRSSIVVCLMVVVACVCSACGSVDVPLSAPVEESPDVGLLTVGRSETLSHKVLEDINDDVGDKAESVDELAAGDTGQAVEGSVVRSGSARTDVAYLTWFITESGVLSGTCVARRESGDSEVVRLSVSDGDLTKNFEIDLSGMSVGSSTEWSFVVGEPSDNVTVSFDGVASWYDDESEAIDLSGWDVGNA